MCRLWREIQQSGENFVRIGLSMLIHGSRPHYLPIWPGRFNSTNTPSTSTTSTIC